MWLNGISWCLEKRKICQNPRKLQQLVYFSVTTTLSLVVHILWIAIVTCMHRLPSIQHGTKEEHRGVVCEVSTFVVVVVVSKPCDHMWLYCMFDLFRH